MSRKRRDLRAGMAAAWAAFAERSEPGYQPDSLGDSDAQGSRAEVSSVSVETPGGADASAV